MPFNPERYHRRSIRLRDYDYTNAGAYFVTVCTHGRQYLLGEITDGVMSLSRAGRIVQTCWYSLPKRFTHVSLDAFVIMPNHIHGVVLLQEQGEPLATGNRQSADEQTADVSPLQDTPTGARAGSLGAIIQGFKTSTTLRINRVDRTPGRTIWQRNYYEHIIRSQKSLDAVRQYVQANPAQWPFDSDNPANILASRGRVTLPLQEEPT